MTQVLEEKVLAFSPPPVSNLVSPTPGIQCYQDDHQFTPIGRYKSIKTTDFLFLYFLLKWQSPLCTQSCSSLPFLLLLLLPVTFPPSFPPVLPRHPYSLPFFPPLPPCTATSGLLQSSHLAGARRYKDALRYCPYPLEDQGLVGRSECEYKHTFDTLHVH